VTGLGMYCKEPMGLILDASCANCDYTQSGLRLGGTREEVTRHDVEVAWLFRASCCKQVQSVQILLGQPLPSPECATCGQSLALHLADRYRIACLSGTVLEGHPCPACAGESMCFVEAGSFL
jgi:hypothetical protein